MSYGGSIVNDFETIDHRCYNDTVRYIDGLVQERHNSIANALELRLSCTNPSIWHPSHPMLMPTSYPRVDRVVWAANQRPCLVCQLSTHQGIVTFVSRAPGSTIQKHNDWTQAGGQVATRQLGENNVQAVTMTAKTEVLKSHREPLISQMRH